MTSYVCDSCPQAERRREELLERERREEALRQAAEDDGKAASRAVERREGWVARTRFWACSGLIVGCCFWLQRVVPDHGQGLRLED